MLWDYIYLVNNWFIKFVNILSIEEFIVMVLNYHRSSIKHNNKGKIQESKDK